MKAHTLLALVILLVQVLDARAATADTRRYAIIVAHTEDIARDIAPLEYADDDGARYYELFSHIADQVTLYTVLDQDSQRLYPRVAAQARTPRRADVLAGVERVFAQAARDVAQGHEVVFYFVLVGHGDIGAGGEGYVSLLDAPFTRTDLFQHVLARSPATTNHIVIDACNSYFMVHRRGGDAVDDGGPSHREAVQSFLAREDLGRYPNTGVLLSTSTEKESHEWSAYGAGVFSHQLRSALAGAADVNGDGLIEYSEVEAFVAAANLRIANPRARVEIFARPPTIDLARPIMDLSASRFRHWLEVPVGAPLRVYLEDARGVRYLDAHLSGERPVILGLADSPYYFVRTSDGTREARIALARQGLRTLDPAALRPSTMAARGSVAEAFRLALYAEPYGPGFYRGFVAARSIRAVAPVQDPWLPRPAAPAAEVPPIPRTSEMPNTGQPVPARGMASSTGWPEPRAQTPELPPRQDAGSSPRRVAAWSAAAVGVGLATAGVWSLVEARTRQNDFRTEHLDANGHVVGISPAAARQAETRARAWSIAGGLMLAGAGIAGVTATVLFVSDGDQVRPGGLAISGSL